LGTLQRHDAARYGKPERVKIDGQAYVIAEDGDGGFLILFCDNATASQTEGQTMNKPADDFRDDLKAGEEAAKHAQESELAASKGEALPGDPAPAPAKVIEPEDEKKPGGGGDMPNPADAQHALNIRPDVVASPAGLETITTMKSQHYDAAQGMPEQEASHRDSKSRTHLMTALVFTPAATRQRLTFR
jgi:hypothetical protein